MPRRLLPRGALLLGLTKNNLNNKVNKMAQKKRILIAQFMRQMAVNSRKSQSYKGIWKNNANKIEAFQVYIGKQMFSDSFTLQITEEYKHYLQSLPEKYKINTVRGFIVKLGHAIKKAGKVGYKIETGFEEISIPVEETCCIYLTEEEIQRIYDLKKISKEQHAARERFVVACCTGMRYSDVSQLTEDNLKGGIIQRKTKKTGMTVEIPLHWMVTGILNRNKGTLPPLKSHQAYNAIIKRICKKAGITENILYEQTHGTRVIRKNVSKYSLVSSHTARRSFATNLHLRSIETGRIMLLTGHTTEESFFRYIRINRRENAKHLSKHAFFTGNS